MALPRVFAAAWGCPGRCEHRPLQGVRRGGGMWFPGCPPARPSAVGADSISARVTLRRRGVARDDASIVPYRGCNNAGFEISRVAANPPLAVGADSISARGPCGGVDSPGRSPRFPKFVGRAFTPAAPRQFQNGNVHAAAGPGGMRASRPTAARGVTATLLAATFTMVRRGGPRSSRKSCAALRWAGFSNILSRPQGGDPPYLNSELFTLNSQFSPPSGSGPVSAAAGAKPED